MDGRGTASPAPEEVEKLTELASPALKRAILFALETGMRAGEIASLRDVRGSVAYLTDTKNGEARQVPLSSRAIDLWQEGIPLSAGSISALFARLCKDASIDGLTFHDLRATAITRLSKRLDALQLAKMIGHKNPKMLMVYYRETAADIAQRLG
jgi:integrase